MQWTLSRVRAAGEAYLRELGRARLARLSGEPAPSAAEIRKAYGGELGQDAIDLALEAAETATPGDMEARSGRALLAWLVELEVQDACAPIDEWFEEWRRKTMIRTPDATALRITAIDRVIARETDRVTRLELDAARVALLEREVAPTLLDRRLRLRDAIERTGVAGSAREVAERLSGENLADLAGDARDALEQSADAWRDSLNDRLRRHLSVSRADARPADLAAAIDASLFDAAFRASDRGPLVRRMLMDLGLDEAVGEHLRTEPRGRADGSATVVVALEVPGDLRFVLGEHAGVDGCRNLLRALGTALRLGHVEGDAPFEHRWLGDPAVPGMCAATFAGLLVDEGWLMRYADLGRNEARRLVAITALNALHALRRACALHIHYMETIDADLAAGAFRDLHVEIVGNALGVPPHGVDAVMEMPSMVTPGATLRAMQGASVLVSELVERFDVDWYRNPRTAAWLVQTVLAPARGESAAEMIKAAVGHDLSFGPCIRRLERALAA